MISIVRIQELIKNAGCSKCDRPIDRIWFSRNDYAPCEPILVMHLAPRGIKRKKVYGVDRLCVPDTQYHSTCELLRVDFSKKQRKELSLTEIQAFLKKHTCPKCGKNIDALEINIGNRSRKEQVALIHACRRSPTGSICSYSECSLTNSELYDMLL
jgi:hypothetical protein